MGAYYNEQILKCIANPPKGIIDCIDIVQCKKEQQLLKSGTPVEYVYIILEGRVIVFEEIITGEIGRVVKLYPGELVGEMEIISEYQKSIYSAVVGKSDTKLMRVRGNDFLRWLELDNRFSQEIIRILARKMCITASLLGSYTLDTSLALVSNYLYEISEEALQKEEIFTVYQSRRDIAENCRLSVRTVNRRIADLKKLNLLSVHKGKIRICKEQMERILELIKNEKYNSGL